MKIQRQIAVQLLRKGITNSVSAVQYDTGVQLVFNVLDFELPSGTSATLYVRKRSGNFVYQEKGITVSGNTVTVDLENQALTEHGETPFQLQFKNGTDIITTFKGVLLVERKLADSDAVESKTVISSFDEVTAEKIAEIEAATDNFIDEARAKVADKGVEVLATIPNDYTETYNRAVKAEREKADAVVLSATGEEITVNDSSDDCLRNLKLLGKTTQIKTTGVQLADFKNGNTSSGITAKFENDVLTVVGDGTGLYQNYGVNITEIYKNNSGKILYFNYERMTSASPLDGTLAQLNILKTDGTRKFVGICTNTETKVPYTIPDDVSDVSSVSCCIYTTNASTASANTVTITKPILQFGTTTLAYEPYTGGKPSPSPEYPQELESVGGDGEVITNIEGANLIPFPENKIAAQQGVTITINKSEITMKGTGTGNAWISLFKVDLPDGEYILSADYIPTDATIYIYSSENILSINRNKLTNSKILPQRNYSFVIEVQSGGVLFNDTIKVMLNKGTKALEFQPYYEPQQIFATAPNGLCGVPVSNGGNFTDKNGQQWICDEIDFERGVLIKRTHTQTFNGTEPFSALGSTGDANAFFYLIDSSIKPFVIENEGFSLSTHFEAKRIISSTTDIGHQVRKISTGEQYRVLFRPNNVSGMTAAQFQTWLKSNPVTVTYALATSTEISLSAEDIEAFKSVHTNFPNTVINGEAYMEIKYNADTKTYIDNKIAELLSQG